MSILSSLHPLSLLSGSPETGSGLGIALVGMVTVFTGLVLLALLLPVLKRRVERRLSMDRMKREESGGEETGPGLSREELAAVTAAIHAHFCLLDRMESMKLTWESYDRPYSPWRLAGRTEYLGDSVSLHNRSRSRMKCPSTE